MKKECIQCGADSSAYQWFSGPTCSKCHQRNRKIKKGKQVYDFKPILTCQDCGKEENRGKYTFKAKYCNLCRNRRYREAKPEQYKASRKHTREKNPEVYKRSEIKFRKKNPEYFRAKAKVRNKRVKQATPKWCNKKELLKIYYNCPIDMQVDHIIPINGENVCGLHVPNNLRYLTPEENATKSNKFETTYLNFEAVNQMPTRAA